MKKNKAYREQMKQKKAQKRKRNEKKFEKLRVAGVEARNIRLSKMKKEMMDLYMKQMMELFQSSQKK